MKKHVDLLAVLFLVYHALGLVIGMGVASVLSVVGVFAGDPRAAGILTLVGSFVATLLLVVSAPGIIAGVGLLKRWWWARYLALVLGFLNLMSFPLGTALGIYAFWTLMQDDSLTLFAASSGSTPAAGSGI